MVKKAVQRGRSERGGEAYSLSYVEPLSDARTKLADFFNILLESLGQISHLDGEDVSAGLDLIKHRPR